MKRILMLAAVLIAALQINAQGYYVEMKVTMNDARVADMKIYAQDGNSRSEINSNVAGMQINMVMLTLKSEADKVYMLDEKAKTYSEISIATAKDYKDAPVSDYEVTVIGKEKLNGYNTTHVRIQKKGETHAIEMWTTKDIADYETLSKIKGKYTGKDNLIAALKAKGAEGFPVRVKAVEMGREVQVDLVKAEKKTSASNMFSLSGYTKTEGINNMGVDMKEMMKKLQDMTPEERERMLKMLEQQYKNQPK